MPWYGRRSALILGMLAIVAPASCAGQTQSGRLTAVEVVDATQAAKTARTDTKFQETVGKDVTSADVSGSIDFTHGRGDEVVRVAPSGSKGTQANAEAGETRWIGDQIFIRGSGFLRSRTGWALVDAAKAQKASPCLAKIGVKGILTGSTTSPDDPLDALRQAGVHLQRVGTATIDGVETTHWRSPGSTEPSVGCDKSDRLHVTVRGTADVWTDRTNRARRIEVTEEESTSITHGTLSMPAFDTTVDLTTTYSDFGAPVTVQRPPADQVTDRTAAFVAQMLGSANPD